MQVRYLNWSPWKSRYADFQKPAVASKSFASRRLPDAAVAKSLYKRAVEFSYSIAIELDAGGVCFVASGGRSASLSSRFSK